MTNLDILFVSTPLLDLSYPPAAPAVLQSIVRHNGKTSNFFDTNLYLYNDICGRNDEVFEKITNKFITPVIDAVADNAVDLDIVDLFFDDDDFHGKYFIRRWLDEVINKIFDYKAEWIGISVFSYFSQRTSFLLAYELKKKNPNCKIVIGGKGSTVALFGPDSIAFSQRLRHMFNDEERENIGSNFYDVMLGLKLCDLAVKGEGENSIMEIWNPKLPEILNAKPINFVRGRVEDLVMEDVPFVDYDNYKLDEYRYITGSKILAITGSKGCVRRCTFCDIGVIWPKFKHRGGEHIAAEIIHLYKKYNVKKFFLTDSLVNGSKSAFKDFVSSLSKAMESENITDLTWHGQYITRPIEQVDQSIYPAMARSGAEGLTIGVETGSDSVRDHMAKKFASKDLDHEMEQFSKHGINTVLLFFSSYPTETWKDFLDTIYMWVRYQRYAADRTIYKMTLGQPYTHHADTPLWLMQDEIELKQDPRSDILWSLESNKELDFIERLVRRVISQEIAVALNLPLARNTPELIQLTGTLKSQRSDIERYFDLSNKSVPLYENIYNLPNVPSVIMTPPKLQEEIYNHLVNTTVEVTLVAHSDTEWLPTITMKLGDTTETFDVTKDGVTRKIQIVGKLNTIEQLELSFANQPIDQVNFYKVNEDSYHSNKRVTITSIKINGCEIAVKGTFINRRGKFTTSGMYMDSLITTEKRTELDSWYKDVLKKSKDHSLIKEMFTNGTFTLDLHFPVLNDIIDADTFMNRDDIRNDDAALTELKYELVKYDSKDQDQWIQMLKNLK
jgi:radical SAM superfamily enzyme YgiQ (UPF0313 family)